MGMQAMYVFLAYNDYLLTVLSGHHDAEFSKGREWHYNSNTLKNAENHIRTVHYLDQGGDIWRVKPGNEGVQASGPVDRGYD